MEAHGTSGLTKDRTLHNFKSNYSGDKCLDKEVRVLQQRPEITYS